MEPVHYVLFRFQLMVDIICYSSFTEVLQKDLLQYRIEREEVPSLKNNKAVANAWQVKINKAMMWL